MMRPIAPIKLDPETQPYWDAARQGTFLLRHCANCNQFHWFARTICPFCWSANTQWRNSPGRGVIYSWTVMRRAKQPYAVAYVELDEGLRMLTNIIHCDLDTLAIGQRVQIVFEQTTDPDAPPVAMFRPE